MSDLEAPPQEELPLEHDFFEELDLDELDDVRPQRRSGIVMGNPILLQLPIQIYEVEFQQS